MPTSWESLAEASKIYSEADFQSAGYQLLTEQVLYDAHGSQRVAYQLISKYRKPFREALDLVGVELRFDDQYRFVAAIPQQFRKIQLPLQDTLLILVLRRLYHDHMTRGEVDAGSALVTIEELKAAYRAQTGRDDLPDQSAQLREALRQMQRFGFVRIIDAQSGSQQPFDIAVLPGIAELVNETALSKLAAHHSALTTRTSGESAASENGSEDENETA
jgi:hypothetical protein